MSRGSTKASSSRRFSEDRFSSHVQAHDATSHKNIISQSCLDSVIPFNLPPRRSMKMLKDGSDFVWPDAAHTLFVKGLQAWKVLTIGSKRTRAPRGEGKTDFLVRYLKSHGVERTKKQVASHLCFELSGGIWTSLRTTMSEVPLRVQSTPDILWQLDTYSWSNSPAYINAFSLSSPQQHSQSPTELNSLPPLPASTSSAQASTSFMTMPSSYNTYSGLPSYPSSQQSTSGGYDRASMAFGAEPYHPHYSQGGNPHLVDSANNLGSGGTASYDIIEPHMFPSAQQASQSQWGPSTTTPRRRPSHPQ
ncbi:hypothetical protein BU17DRAFT_69355 [Hysterangium stoloniferum]|nr:hypothetical protein BU17DRAFT_69355 [Hysterangium stoloniferum]